MRIAIASDHAGFAYKERLRELLQAAGYEVLDFGTSSEESTDYPISLRQRRGRLPKAKPSAASCCAAAVWG
jgi:ribose 5-phosphate isomerase RpiB